VNDHPLDELEDLAALVARDHRWIVRGPEVVLRVDLVGGGHLEITPRGSDRHDLLLVDQDRDQLERLLVLMASKAPRPTASPLLVSPDVSSLDLA
jgi:hypothetical protein